MTQVFATPVPGEPWTSGEDDEITDRVQASSAEGEHGLGSGAHVSPVTSEGVSPPFATPEPGVAWTSGEVDAMTAYIQARNAALDPLLAEAWMWLDGTDLPDGWEPEDGLVNKGTVGSALNGLLAIEDLDDGHEVSTTPVPGTPVAVEGAVRCPLMGAHNGYHFYVPDHPALAGDGSFMVTIDLTRLEGEGDDDIIFLRKLAGGSQSTPGWSMEDISLFGVPGLSVVWPIGDGETNAAIGTGHVGGIEIPRVFTRQRWSMKIDRDTDLLTGYIDGEVHEQDDMSEVGDITSPVSLIVGSGFDLHHVMLHPEDSAAFADPAALHAALGVS